jgi:predicted Zn-dependent peptidase
LTGTIPPVEDLLAKTEAVTHEDVRRVIDRVFTGSPIVAVVGPVEAGSLSGHPLLGV